MRREGKVDGKGRAKTGVVGGGGMGREVGRGRRAIGELDPISELESLDREARPAWLFLRASFVVVSACDTEKSLRRKGRNKIYTPRRLLDLVRTIGLLVVPTDQVLVLPLGLLRHPSQPERARAPPGLSVHLPDLVAAPLIWLVPPAAAVGYKHAPEIGERRPAER